VASARSTISTTARRSVAAAASASMAVSAVVPVAVASSVSTQMFPSSPRPRTVTLSPVLSPAGNAASKRSSRSAPSASSRRNWTCLWRPPSKSSSMTTSSVPVQVAESTGGVPWPLADVVERIAKKVMNADCATRRPTVLDNSSIPV